MNAGTLSISRLLQRVARQRPTAFIMLARSTGHSGGVMIDDHPLIHLLYKREAVAGGQRGRLPVSHVGKRVVASLDRGVSVDTNQLHTKGDLQMWQRSERGDEVIA